MTEATHRHTTQSKFDVTGMKSLPKVGIVYSHSQVDADVMTPFLTKGYKGIVHAGVGNSNIHKNILPSLLEARKKEILVVRSSRVSFGPTSMDGEVDNKLSRFVASIELNPQKARILLMLTLIQIQDWEEIQ